MRILLYSLLLWLPLTMVAAEEYAYFKQFPLRQQTKYFNFYYRRNPERIADFGRFADGFIGMLKRDFFEAEFDYPIRVVVLEDTATFQNFLRKELYMADPPTIGMYFPASEIYVTCEDSGLETFTHGIMYPLMHRNMRDAPTWAREGVPAFFEMFYGYWREDEPIVHWGYHHPGRIKMLGTNLTQLDLKNILATQIPKGRFHESDLRMVSMFLWEQGKLPRFLQLLKRREKTEFNSTFEAALEMPVEQIIPLWNKYLEQVAARRDNIMMLPRSTMVNNEAGFQRFVRGFKIPIEPPKKSPETEGEKKLQP